MKIGIAIQTHPLRHDMASTLARVLEGGGELDVVQVYDPRPHDDRPSAWRTYRWALERALVPSCDWTHLLVIQDDTAPCRHLPELLPAVVAAQPASLIALFHSGAPLPSAARVREAASAGIPFAEMLLQQWMPVVATVWPVDRIGPAIEWVDAQRFQADWTADDEIVGRVARALGIPAVATAPSLVEHPDAVVSLAGRRPPSNGADPYRVAAVFAGDRDLRGVDWSAAPHAVR